MIRIIDYFMTDWKKASHRKPLLLRGARQVGKTFSVRVLGKQFEDFLEVNFETMPEVIKIFEPDLDAYRILKELGLYFGKPIIPGKTLLFLDETQVFPRSILSLRYFYEQVPELHVICAGSLLDFAIEQVGVPVGRISLAYMYPVSFIEFLLATDHAQLVRAILEHPQASFPEIIHNKILRLVYEYMAVGGMPEAVKIWIETHDPLRIAAAHTDIVETFKQDFQKYAKKKQIPHVSMIFEAIPRLVGKKFKFSEVSDHLRKRELAPALQLLVSANVAHKIFHTSAHGVPLGGQIDTEKFKVILLDVSLMQNILGWKPSQWAIHDFEMSGIRGQVIEAFIGQELLAYSSFELDKNIYYWHREAKASNAEVDYVISRERSVVPIEVKAGVVGRLRSLNAFLLEHKEWTKFGIRFSANHFSQNERIYTFPLYAVSRMFAENEFLRKLVDLS